jgi:hypothetical protein
MIRPYLDGVLSDRELEEFLGHVQTCPDCFDELEIYYSVYRTLSNVDEKGDYNYARKLRSKLADSSEYLRIRYRNKLLKVAVILAAQLCVAWALYGLFRFPGGYIDRHHTEMIPVIESEAAASLETDGTLESMDMETDPGTSTGTDMAAGTGTSTGTDMAADTGTSTGTDMAADIGTDSGTDMVTDTGTLEASHE